MSTVNICFLGYNQDTPASLYALMDSSFWYDTINLGGSIVYVQGVTTGYIFQIKLFLSLKIIFV